MEALRVVLLGFGNVGKAFVRELRDRGLSGYLKAVFSSRGGVVVKGEEDLEGLALLAASGRRLEDHPGFRELRGLEYMSENPEGAAVFAIPPSYATGEPNLALYRGALRSGYHVVTCDKTGLALAYDELLGLARSRGLLLRYTATVSAGTPVVPVARALRHRRVESVRGVLNSTSNYVLGLVERGMSWEDAIGEAVRAGLAEPDPSVDVDGLDAAAKLVILLNEMGLAVGLNDVRRVSVRVFTEEEVRRSLPEGLRLKQVAGFDADGRRAFVAPVFVPLVSPLAFTEGEYNTVEFRVDGGSMVVHGPAGPAWRTARVLVADLLDVLEEADRSRRRSP